MLVVLDRSGPTPVMQLECNECLFELDFVNHGENESVSQHYVRPGVCMQLVERV